MMDENSLVASINKVLVKDESNIHSKINKSNNLYYNNSQNSNPFGENSKQKSEMDLVNRSLSK
jgi:hypothetical protein